MPQAHTHVGVLGIGSAWAETSAADALLFGARANLILYARWRYRDRDPDARWRMTEANFDVSVRMTMYDEKDRFTGDFITVDEKSGVIYAYGPGVCQVMVPASDGSSLATRFPPYRESSSER